MSGFTFDEMVLMPCTIPRQKLLEMARTYRDFEGDSDANIESALAELRWEWGREKVEQQCPYPHVALLNGAWFEVRNHESGPFEGYQSLRARPDGGWNFAAVYYDGGAHWLEIAEEMMARHLAAERQ